MNASVFFDGQDSKAGLMALPEDTAQSASHLATTLAMETGKIAKFRRLLAQEGSVLDAERLIRDPIYAYKQMAAAHCSEDPVLRKLSVELFEHYEYLELRRHLELLHEATGSLRH